MHIAKTLVATLAIAALGSASLAQTQSEMTAPEPVIEPDPTGGQFNVSPTVVVIGILATLLFFAGSGDGCGGERKCLRIPNDRD